MSERRLLPARNGHRALSLVLALVLSLVSPRSWAGAETVTEDQEAQAAFDRAVKLAQEKHYPEAVAALEQAAALDPTPPILFNLGRMREETGDLMGAVRAYRELLGRTRDKRMRKQAESRLHEVEGRAEPAPAPAPVVPAPAPAPPPVVPVAVLFRPAPPPRTDRPLHKKAWFWVAVVGGALVLSGAAVGVTLALTQKAAPGPPNTDLGNMRFFLP